MLSCMLNQKLVLLYSHPDALVDSFYAGYNALLSIKNIRPGDKFPLFIAVNAK